MALGATTADALKLVMREGLALTLAGTGLGLPLAVGTGKLLGTMLCEVSGTDPVVLIAAPLTLAAISLAACYLPARRAARVKPVVALRCE